MVAAGRAVGARESDPAMRNPDLLAEKLLGPDEIALIKEHPISAAMADTSGNHPGYEAMGIAVMMLIRTKFIDEKLEHALEDGATQVVILGAGFDTRAYRLAERLKHVRVFEADSAATQQYKRRRIEAALGDPPPNLTYVTIDFNREKVIDALRHAGYDPSQKTFFTWEGVSMYVAESGVRETLGAIAREAVGSTLIMDYTTQASLDFMAKFPDYGPAQFLAAWGEPWIFGVPDGQDREFFTELGFEPREFFPVFSPESVKRYLTRADGTVVGAPPPGAPRPQPPPEVQSAGALLAQSGRSFYTLVELATKS
jgi:methyltransferase (TIGR00027 family)